MRVVDRAVFERIRGRLARLYGEAELPRLLQRLELLVGRYGVGSHCLAPDAPRARCRGWDQRDAVLIAYADMVRDDDAAPVMALRRFLEQRVGDAISVVHLLPFFPSSSDDGFAVIDYRTVDPALGTWDDIEALGEPYRLAVDLVINHVSGQSHWFRAYCNGIAPERHYFIEVDPSADVSAVVRPRTTPLLRAVQTPSGERHIWATFGHDQLDVDFSNPDVLFEYLDILLLYVHHGAQLIRLDAIAFLWKRIGTPCIHLPETHELVKLLRDVLEMLAPGVLLLSETNVPHAENISYFGAGDEAHMVYQFSLPPLLLHALHTGDAAGLTRWASDLAPPPAGCTYLNFTASHDGIGLRPLEGLVPPAELAALVAAMEQRSALVSRRASPDGSATPYELNITYFDAVGVPGDRDASIRRFLCAQTIAMGLQGIPGVYFNSLLGAGNDLAGVAETGRARSINRRKWTVPELDAMLAAGSEHQAALVLPEYLRRLHLRAAQPAFHPAAPQTVLDLPRGMFGVRRDAPETGQRLWLLANLTGRTLGCAMSRLDRHWQRRRWQELISGWEADGAELASRLQLAPHQVVWLVQAPNERGP